MINVTSAKEVTVEKMEKFGFCTANGFSSEALAKTFSCTLHFDLLLFSLRLVIAAVNHDATVYGCIKE